MNIADLRNYGNLPVVEKLADAKITPHYDAAIREIKRLITPALYATITAVTPVDPRLADLTETVYAQAMVLLLPSANAMYSEGISDLEETGIGRRWLTPNEIKARIEIYKSRVAELLSVVTDDGDDDTEPVKPQNFYWSEL